MTGIKEVPVCLSVGSGKFEATVSNDKTSIDYTLTYDKLDGVPTVAHIHLGKPTDAGGIMVNLCGENGTGDNGNGSNGTNVCSEGSGTVSGTITAEDVVGPVDQGIEAGNFDDLLLAMKRGLTYVNLHSDICPNGEIRGQVVRRVAQP
jgi:hypothetical protein